jgi:hypothetical protein
MRMRGFIVNIVVEHLLAGHSVSIGCGRPERMKIVRQRIVEALDDLEVIDQVVQPKFYTNSLELKNGANAYIFQLQRFTGTSAVHTPVLILQDVDVANHALLPDARAIAHAFPDGRPPIVIEC